jgi:hypothetical protein
MDGNSSGGTSSSTSYPSVLHTLNTLGERARKHRRSTTSTFLSSSSSGGGAGGDADRSRDPRSVFDNVLADADQLLFSLKHHSMHSDSASSRVMEAQAWMHKAAIEKAACRAEDEAAAYLTASALWTAIEVERKSLNVLTSGDALARAVLCCAMGCNVLLTIKPNITTSPLPIKLTRMLHQHISKCWSVCVRVASLLSDFGCYEMSADYYELAAILVTVDAPPPATSALPKKAGGAAPLARQASTSTVSHHVDVAAASTSSACGGGDTLTRSTSTTLRFQSSFQVEGGSSSPTASSSVAGGGARQLNGRRGLQHQHQQSSPTQSVRSRMTAGTASIIGGGGGHAAQHNRVFRAGERVFSGAVYGELKKGTPPIALILNGFLDQYLVALSSCAMTCALIQDYPRCLSVIDDLLMHVVGIETARRPPELTTSWIRRVVTSGGLHVDSEATQQRDDDARTLQSYAAGKDDEDDDDATATRNDSTRTALFKSVIDECDDSRPLVMSSDRDDIADNVSVSRPSLSSPPPTPELMSSGGELMNNMSLGSRPIVPSLPSSAPTSAAAAGVVVDRSSATPSSTVPAATGATATSTQRNALSPQQNREQLLLLQQLPLAPPPGGSLHAHAVFSPLQHLFFLMEVEGITVQMRLVKVLCLIALRDPNASHTSVRDEIQALRDLASLHRAHERKTKFRSLNRDCANAATSTFSATLYRLTATLETLQDVIERYPIATTRRAHAAPLAETQATEDDGGSAQSAVASGCRHVGHRTVDQESAMRIGFEEVNLICKELGLCSRNLVVLLERARRSVIGI